MGNISKREARLEHRAEFVRSIDKYREELPEPRDYTPIRADPDGPRVTVHVRKRPIFDRDVKRGEYDVVTAANPRVVVHDCRMQADLVRMYVDHVSFPFDNVFSEDTTSEEVYENAAAALVPWAVNGGISTLFAYGQTGSGKTYTMTAIEHFAMRDLFEALEKARHGHRDLGRVEVSVTFFEIAGKSCHDLLNGGASVNLMVGADAAVHVMGAVEQRTPTLDDMLDAVRKGLDLRKTRSTDVNDVSSRSHAVLRVYLRRPDRRGSVRAKGSRHDGMRGGRGGGGGDSTVFGQLTLVDLAGSERNADSKGHDAERMKEAAEINSSLMALKECLRMRAQKGAGAGGDVHVNYRASRLTQLLKSAFTSPRAMTVVVATVSPNPTDTEHSINTLRHACLMKSKDSDVKTTRETVLDEAQFLARYDPLPVAPAKWSHTDVMKWVSTVENGAYAKYAANMPAALDGRQLVRLPEKRFVAYCDDDYKQGESLFAAVRKAITSVSDAAQARRDAMRDAFSVASSGGGASAGGGGGGGGSGSGNEAPRRPATMEDGRDMGRGAGRKSAHTSSHQRLKRPPRSSGPRRGGGATSGKDGGGAGASSGLESGSEDEHGGHSGAVSDSGATSGAESDADGRGDPPPGALRVLRGRIHKHRHAKRAVSAHELRAAGADGGVAGGAAGGERVISADSHLRGHRPARPGGRMRATADRHPHGGRAGVVVAEAVDGADVDLGEVGDRVTHLPRPPLDNLSQGRRRGDTMVIEVPKYGQARAKLAADMDADAVVPTSSNRGSRGAGSGAGRGGGSGTPKRSPVRGSPLFVRRGGKKPSTLAHLSPSGAGAGAREPLSLVAGSDGPVPPEEPPTLDAIPPGGGRAAKKGGLFSRMAGFLRRSSNNAASASAPAASMSGAEKTTAARAAGVTGSGGRSGDTGATGTGGAGMGRNTSPVGIGTGRASAAAMTSPTPMQVTSFDPNTPSAQRERPTLIRGPTTPRDRRLSELGAALLSGKSPPASPSGSGTAEAFSSGGAVTHSPHAGSSSGASEAASAASSRTPRRSSPRRGAGSSDMGDGGGSGGGGSGTGGGGGDSGSDRVSSGNGARESVVAKSMPSHPLAHARARASERADADKERVAELETLLARALRDLQATRSQVRDLQKQLDRSIAERDAIARAHGGEHQSAFGGRTAVVEAPVAGSVKRATTAPAGPSLRSEALRATTVDAFLEALGLKQYVRALRALGVDTVHALPAVSEVDLDDICMKRMHKRLFLMHAARVAPGP